MRNRKKIILIGAEGKNETEKRYFTVFNQKQNTYRILFAKGNNTDPEAVLRDLLNNACQEEINVDNGDVLVCLIDVDFKNGREKQLRAMLKKSRKSNVCVYVSNPTFEIWYLLHFRYSTRQYSSNEELIKELNTYIPNYQKSLDIFETIFSKMDFAIKNAKKLEQYHAQNGVTDSLAKLHSTDIYKLVERIQERNV